MARLCRTPWRCLAALFAALWAITVSSCRIGCQNGVVMRLLWKRILLRRTPPWICSVKPGCGLIWPARSRGRVETADKLAYLRDAQAYRNALLVEQRNGDFAQTLMRQYLFDAWHLPVVQALQSSSMPELAAIAAKATPEVTYHLERSSDLIIRLGDGSDESHRRMQDALDLLWPYAGGLLANHQSDAALVNASITPNPQDIQQRWSDAVNKTLSEATLKQPDNSYVHQGGRNGVHTEHLGFILAEMQFLQRSYPGASW